MRERGERGTGRTGNRGKGNVKGKDSLTIDPFTHSPLAFPYLPRSPAFPAIFLEPPVGRRV